MNTWSQPPIAKVYEALGSLADDRVKLTSPTLAQVASSSGDKVYIVEWAEDFSWITSNDNASHWQGYLGYPIIAILLLQGKIKYDRMVAEALKGIAWKEINTRHKNNYAKAIAEILEQINSHNTSREDIVKECERIHTELRTCGMKRPLQRRRPPVAAKQKEPISRPNSQGNLFT